MTVEQIRAILLAIADQQAEVQRVQVMDSDPGTPLNSQQVVGAFFTDGTIDYYDVAGKPVFPT